MLIVKAVVVFSSLRCRYLQNKQQILSAKSQPKCHIITTPVPATANGNISRFTAYRLSSYVMIFGTKKAVLTPHKQFIDPTIPTNNRCFFQWLCYALTRRLSVAAIYVPIMRLRQRMRVFRACFIFSRFFKNLYNSKERRKKLRLSSTYLII